MKRVVTCLSLSLLMFTSEASALEIAFDEETRDLVAVGVPEAAAVAEVTDGEVAEPAPAPKARELWRYRTMYQTGHAIPPAPVITSAGGEELVVYCVGGSLYEAGARTGVVRFRRLIPGSCVGLEAVGGAVEVTIDPAFRALFSAESEPSPDSEMTTLTYTPGEHTRGVESTPRVSTFGFDARAQVTRRIEDAAREGAPSESDHGPLDLWLNRRTTYGEPPEETMAFGDMVGMSEWRAGTPEGMAWTARVLEMMAAGRALDPTNPWFAFHEGMAYWETGREDQARAAWATLDDTPPDLAFETIRMLPLLARVGAPPELIRSLRAHITESMLRGGYEPELSRSLIWMALNWRTAPPKLDLSDPSHLAIADSYAEDWYALMPLSEGVDAAQRSIAAAHREAGNSERAAELDRRTAAHPGEFVTSKHEDVSWALYGLPIPPALALAVTLLFMVGMLRRLGGRFVAEEGGGRAPWWLRFNPMAATDRGALLGMFAITLFAAYVTWKMAAGVAFIGVSAESPISWTSNQLGHDEVGEYLEGFEQTPDVLFARGLHHQLAGDLERAKARYAESETPSAWNNLGVILRRAGDDAGAQDAWAKAGEIESARFNASGEVTGDHSARLAKYAPEHEMLALPTQEMRDTMYMSKAREVIEEQGALNVLMAQTSVSGEVSGSDAEGLHEILSSVVAQALMLVLLLFGAFAPRRGYRFEPRALGKTADGGLAGVGVLGWLGGLLTPGGAHGLGLLRPWLAAATLTSIVLHVITENLGGETSSILLSIASPSFDKMFGVDIDAADFTTPIDATLMAFGEAWWVLALGSLALGVAVEFVRPDPIGMIARARAERDGASS